MAKKYFVLKILMLNNEYPPMGGGTGTVNKEILERMALYPNLKIDLITRSNEKKRKTTQISDNIRIIYIPLKSKNIHHASNFELIQYSFFSFWCAFKMQRKEKYDFSFAWSTVPAGFVSLLLNILFKLPYLVRVGGPDIPGFEQRYKKIYLIITPVIKLIWRKSKLLITKCHVEKEMVRDINPKLNLKIVYNGVDSLKFKPYGKAPNKELLIICPARLIQRKGQDLIIKAISRLKEMGIIFHVDLIGEGDEKENYIKLSKDLSVYQQIQFKGYIPRENLGKAYQQADIFVLPSYNEGMSNSLLEAMACGLPVVVTDVGGTSELVSEGENGFVFRVGDIEKLTSILENIAKNPAALVDMGRKSKNIAEKYRWENIVTEYILIFESLNNS